MNTKTVNSVVKTFLSQINSCQNEAQERVIVQKELAVIRKEFSNPKINAHSRMINAYKLVAIGTLGYEIDCGMVEIITSLANSKFANKHAGYLAFLTCFRNVPEACSLLINTMQFDLQNAKEEVICETLSTLSIIADSQISEVLGPMVMKLAFGFGEPIIRKKAFLVLKRMYKFFPNLISLEPEFIKKVESLLQKEYDQSVLQSLCKFILEIIVKEKKDGDDLKKYQCISVPIVHLFKSLLTDPNPESTYYGVSMPWLIADLIKLVPLLPMEKRELVSFQSLCEEFLQIGFNDSMFDMPPNQRNISFAIQIEIMKYGFESESSRIGKISISLLSRLLDMNDININYLTLELLIVATQNGYKESTKKLFAKVILLIASFDSSMKKRAFDALFVMCDSSNVGRICQVYTEMINDEEIGDLKEDLIFKLSILSDKYLKGKEYVDVMMNVALNGGKYIPHELWNRTLRKLSEDQDAARHSILLIEKIMKKNVNDDSFLELCCLIVGEFGEYFEDIVTFAETLCKKSKYISNKTKVRVISSLMKLLKKNINIKDSLKKMCQQNEQSTHCELQQRIAECLFLINHNEMIGVAIDTLTFKEKAAEETEVGDSKEMIEEKETNEFVPIEGNPKINGSELIDILGMENKTEFKKKLQFNFVHSLNPTGLKEKAQVIYRKMLSLNEGIVFQDQNIQIGYRSKVIDNVIGVQLFYGNMTQNSISVDIHVLTPFGIVSSIQHDQMVIETRQQKNHVIQMKVTSSFLDSPQLQVNYKTNENEGNFAFSLPITLLKLTKQTTQRVLSPKQQIQTIPCSFDLQHIQSLFGPFNLTFSLNDQVIEAVGEIPSVALFKIQFYLKTQQLCVTSLNDQLNSDITALIMYALQ